MRFYSFLACPTRFSGTYREAICRRSSTPSCIILFEMGRRELLGVFHDTTPLADSRELPLVDFRLTEA